MAEHSQQSINLLHINNKSPSADCQINFTEVYQQHRLTIYRYCLARIGHIDDAQDVTAQVFLKAYRSLETYRQEAPLIAWLIGITRRQIADYYRGQQEYILLSTIPDIPHRGLSLEESVEHKHKMKRVAEALTALSDDRREAITMRLFAGLQNQDIASIMNKTPDAVAMLVHRGIQDLKTRLGEEE